MAVKVLMRRALWVLSCFRAEVPKSEKRRVASLTMNYVGTPDPAVALTAVEASESMIGDVDFLREWLNEDMGRYIEATYAALRTCNTLDGQLKVMDLVNTLLDLVR